MTSEEVTLRDYVDLRVKNVEGKIDALRDYMAQHFELNELAIKKAEEAMLVRLERMNQFREQVTTERACFANKESVESRLDIIERRDAFAAGKLWMIALILTVIPTILALIALFRS